MSGVLVRVLVFIALVSCCESAFCTNAQLRIHFKDHDRVWMTRPGSRLASARSVRKFLPFLRATFRQGSEPNIDEKNSDALSLHREFPVGPVVPIVTSGDAGELNLAETKLGGSSGAGCGASPEPAGWHDEGPKLRGQPAETPSGDQVNGSGDELPLVETKLGGSSGAGCGASPEPAGWHDEGPKLRGQPVETPSGDPVAASGDELRLAGTDLGGSSGGGGEPKPFQSAGNVLDSGGNFQTDWQRAFDAFTTEMKGTVRQLEADNTHLRKEIGELKTESAKLEADNTQLRKEIGELKAESAKLEADNKQLHGQIDVLNDQMLTLGTRIAMIDGVEAIKYFLGLPERSHFPSTLARNAWGVKANQPIMKKFINDVLKIKTTDYPAVVKQIGIDARNLAAHNISRQCVLSFTGSSQKGLHGRPEWQQIMLQAAMNTDVVVKNKRCIQPSHATKQGTSNTKSVPAARKKNSQK